MFDIPDRTGCESSFHMTNEIRKQLLELECFKTCITEIVENYIKMLDNKLSMQDLEIANAESYMKEHLQETVMTIIEEGIKQGLFAVGVNYNEVTEEMNIVLTGGNE